MTLTNINKKIKKLPYKTRGMVSDGYHTFDELYHHRCTLFATLLNLIAASNPDQDVWKSRKNRDGSEWEGWFVAGIGKEITYHLPDPYWGIMEVKEIPAGKWDGHDSKDVLKRLVNLAAAYQKHINESTSKLSSDKL